MTCLIRKIDPSDIAQLIEIEKSATQAFSSIPELSWLVESPVLSAQDHLQLISSAYAFVAINQKNQATGFFFVVRQALDLYIIELDVSAAFQKQGIGRQLIEYVIATAQGEGCDAVTLTTFHDVIWNRPFYEKLGVEKINALEMPLYLEHKLEHEVAYGFSRNSRCAMRLALN